MHGSEGELGWATTPSILTTRLECQICRLANIIITSSNIVQHNFLVRKDIGRTEASPRTSQL